MKLTFDNDKTLTFDALLSDEWKKIKAYDYVYEDLSLIETLNEEIFKKENLVKIIEDVKIGDNEE